MTSAELLADARLSMEQLRWRDAYAEFLAADREVSLAPDDLERLAVNAHLIGEDRVSVASWERAHHDLLAVGDVARAARCAFWLAFGLLNLGEMARGGGWLARAQRLLDDHGLDTAERGYLRVPAGLQALDLEGDAGAAYDAFREAAEYGERFGDLDLVTMGRLGQAQAMIRRRQVAEGVALLDEVMVVVTAEDVSPVVTGTVYCAVILACRELFDLRRAHEWTEALNEWCEAQPDLVPFRGQCLVHRSEIQQFHGLWTKAWEEARHAGERLAAPPGQPAQGMAHYQQGELLRLWGRFVEADRAYRRASEAGHDPYPGLALLRLAQGHVEEAVGALRRVLRAASDWLGRARMLAAYVEATLTAGDLAGARGGVDELARIAEDLDAPLLHAMAAHATGMVDLERGAIAEALDAFSDARARWRRLEAPYEHARARVGFGLACRALGDEQTAELELAVAHKVLAELGAVPDAERVVRLMGARPGDGSVLTPRQLEVLALVAAGHTNRGIAAELVVSEHTVRRHLQNIYTRVGVASRAAAVAYAVERGLV
jgi:DNA-binding CsgD family transcriptional regulator